MDLKNTESVENALLNAYNTCENYRHQFIMPEHLLNSLLMQPNFAGAVDQFCDMEELSNQVKNFLDKLERVPDFVEKYEPINSLQFSKLLINAAISAENSGSKILDVPHIVKQMLDLKESWASYILHKNIENDQTFLSEIITAYSDKDDEDEDDGEELVFGDNYYNNEKYSEIFDDEDNPKQSNQWEKYLTNISQTYKNHNPLIGRKQELQRTIQILCRKDKNNPLYVGEPGVGKTSLIYGLAKLIDEKKIPEKLLNTTIYSLDLGALVAGTQYRGDFEKRIKQIMDGIEKNENPVIVYIDEIHNLVGTGSVGDSSLDASNMLKPYLEQGNIKFIGSTTYDEYKRYFEKSKGIVRRFQQIDVQEPTINQTIEILKGLKKQYEKFHNVVYTNESIVFAAQASAKYINNRFLPDKAIDLIDEAGAYRQINPLKQKKQIVDEKLISDILTKICKIDAQALIQESNSSLEKLEENIKSKIFGQNQAVEQVTQAVQMAKAGLLDDNKPLASLLFVGPTGVGKTEVCKVLAQELGITLVRFDMSEYAEKHTVAKLIGSPAGYVGYEDGGLLTDAIRKTPNCVLLLDEIEKAHTDIYNILLQVMDYAVLTDNKGNKADFKNVILIMTSNAGAQNASKPSVGFANAPSASQAMMKAVKQTFKPEFINRLSATVLFNDMDKQMAEKILIKKIDEIKTKLKTKNVELNIDEKAVNLLLDLGFTREYGARELDRVITQKLKTLLTKEILFGQLKNGGTANISTDNENLILTTN